MRLEGFSTCEVPIWTQHNSQPQRSASRLGKIGILKRFLMKVPGLQVVSFRQCQVPGNVPPPLLFSFIPPRVLTRRCLGVEEGKLTFYIRVGVSRVGGGWKNLSLKDNRKQCFTFTGPQNPYERRTNPLVQSAPVTVGQVLHSSKRGHWTPYDRGNVECGYDSAIQWLPAFRRNMSPPCSRWNEE
jgi:hypothetical protein